MENMIKHPLYFLFTRGKGKNSPDNRTRLILFTIPFIMLLLLAFTTAICPCTLFTGACFLQLFLVVTMAGRYAAVSISSEREKNTLDHLRLTTLGPAGIIKGKIIPDVLDLFRIMAVTTPFLIFMALISPTAGVLEALLASFISMGAGITLVCGLVCLSAYCPTVSSSIVASWILRGVWIFATPLIDGLLAKILLRPSTIPIFSSINPAVPLLGLLMPGSFDGTPWLLSSYLYPVAVFLFVAVTFMLSKRFIERGIERKGRAGSSGILGKGSVSHSLSDKIGIFGNPVFLKEMVPFKKGIFGLIPGVLVFALLFLAPCLYFTGSALQLSQGYSIMKPGHVAYAVPETGQTANNMPANGGENSSKGITVTTGTGQMFTLHGHKCDCCLRLMLYEFVALPLPAKDMIALTTPVQEGNLSTNTTGNVSGGQVASSDVTPPPSSTFTASAKEMITTENKSMLFGGFYAGLFLVLAYLVIRASGFLCSTYNTEKNKLTWDVLTLTQLSPENIVNGKLLGVLFIPLIQMSLGFLALLFWIYKGVLTVSGGVTLYIFCIAVAIVCGLLGQYTSLRSPSAHISQGSTLAKISIFVLSLPLVKIGAAVLFLVLLLLLNSFTLSSLAVFLPLAGFFAYLLYTEPGLRRFAIPVAMLFLLFFRSLPGSFVYTPFLTSGIYRNSFCESGPITCDPLNFIITMAFLITMGYFLRKSTVEKLRKEYYT